MVRAKGILLGLFLLAIASAKGTDVEGHVKVDYVENVRVQTEALGLGGRIVSGWDATPGQHPHQVALRHVSVAGSVSACGGVLVRRYWVLTAAHCTGTHPTVVVRAGVTNMTGPEYISETTVYYNHPLFNSLQPLVVQPNDISIIQLQTPVKYTDLVKPIRVQPRVDAYRNYQGQWAYASGFGRTWTGGTSPEVLQWVYLTLISNLECRAHFGTHITDHTICAGPYNVTSQSICQGDSGGPLVHTGADGVPTLVGLSSFVAGGTDGCHSGRPGAFTRPGPFLDWIEEVTGLDLEEEEDITTEAPTTEAPTTTQAPTTTEEPTTTETPTTTLEPESEESSEESSEEESSEENSSEEDPELQKLLKQLEVRVNVKVKMNKFKKKHEVHVKHDVKKHKH